MLAVLALASLTGLLAALLTALPWILGLLAGLLTAALLTALTGIVLLLGILVLTHYAYSMEFRPIFQRITQPVVPKRNIRL